MFFEEIDEIPGIAGRNGTSVFVVPRETEVKIPGAIVVQPEDKTVISIEQARGIQDLVQKRQTGELFIVLRPAEKLGEEAANALLKTLEQPGDKVHFVLITDRPSQLLTTILSRAAVYVWRRQEDLTAPVQGSEQMKTWARKLLRGEDLVATAKAIAKAKAGGVQAQAFEVLEIAVEMAYKSYFLTQNRAFLRRITQLTTTYENIAAGGNVKLQIVANLC